MRVERKGDARSSSRFQGIDEETYAALQVPVIDAMERQVPTFSSDASVESATWALLARGADAAPVVDAQGRLVGFVTMADLVRARVENDETGELLPPRGNPDDHGDDLDEMTDGFHETQVARTLLHEVMSEDLVALSARATLHEAVLLMARYGIDRLTVTAADRRVVGVLSTRDIVRWLARQAGHATH